MKTTKLDSWDTASFHHNSSNEKISLMLVSSPKDGMVNRWQAELVNLPHLQVVATASSSIEFINRLQQYAPEVILLSSYLVNNMKELTELLAKVQNAIIYVLLPSRQEIPSTSLESEVLQISSVRAVWRTGEMPSISDIYPQLEEAARTLRNRAPEQGTGWQSSNGRQQYLGTKIITIWNRSGGCGKSTVALSMAYSLSQRNVRTLLIGLGVPDTLPLKTGKPWRPNLEHWFANQSPDGLSEAVQSVNSNFDVLFGPRTIAQEKNFFAAQREPLVELKNQAILKQYGVILFDASISLQARGAIRASNTLVLVSRPTLEDAALTAESYRFVVRDEMGHHAIPPESIYLLINMDGEGGMDEPNYMGALQESFRAYDMPDVRLPIMKVLPQVAELMSASYESRSPLMVDDRFSKGIHEFTDQVMGGLIPQTTTTPKKRFKISFKL